MEQHSAYKWYNANKWYSANKWHGAKKWQNINKQRKEVAQCKYSSTQPKQNKKTALNNKQTSTILYTFLFLDNSLSLLL